MMECLNCRNVMTQKKYEDVQIDECPSCGSVWLDRGELNAIVDRQQVQFSNDEKTIALKSVQEDSSSGKTLVCPKCESETKKFNYAFGSGIIIDRCPEKCGVWLDRNELEAIQIVMEKEADDFADPQDDAQKDWQAATRKRCPSCRRPLREVDVKGAMLDICPDCKGYWCDDGELTAIITKHLPLVEAGGRSDAAIVPLDPAPKRFCPVCSELLDTRQYDYSSPIAIDRCKHAHGIWLDEGEMEKVIEWVNESERQKEGDLTLYAPLLNRVRTDSAIKTSAEQSQLRVSRFSVVNSFARYLAFQGACR